MIQKIGKPGGKFSSFNWLDGVAGFNAEVYSFTYIGRLATGLTLVQKGTAGTAMFALKSSGGRKFRITFKGELQTTRNETERSGDLQAKLDNEPLKTLTSDTVPAGDNCEIFKTAGFARFVSLPGGENDNNVDFQKTLIYGSCFNGDPQKRKKINFIKTTGIFVVRQGDIVQINNQPTDDIFGFSTKLFP